MLKGIGTRSPFEFEKTFMFYLPGSASTASTRRARRRARPGRSTKRTEDGIVLVDQDSLPRAGGCAADSGRPYKKVYFNHKTGKAEKCTFCYPRVEVGLPTVCETCVGRLRYIGLVFYDADKVLEAASVEKDTDLYAAQRACFLDPDDLEVQQAARDAGIPQEWVRRRAVAGGSSSASTRWPSLAPGVPHHADGLASRRCPRSSTSSATPGTTPRTPATSSPRSTPADPGEYLANLSPPATPDRSTRRCGGWRPCVLLSAGAGPSAASPAWRWPKRWGCPRRTSTRCSGLLAIAKYADRYVIPTAHAEQAHRPRSLPPSARSTGTAGRHGGSGPVGRAPPAHAGRDREPAGPQRPARRRPPTASWSAGQQERPGQPVDLGRQGIPRACSRPSEGRLMFGCRRRTAAQDRLPRSSCASPGRSARCSWTTRAPPGGPAGPGAAGGR